MFVSVLGGGMVGLANAHIVYDQTRSVLVTASLVCVVAIMPVGLALKLDQTILTALVQIATPAQSRAVFFTYYGLIPMVAVPVGQMAIGVIADRLSVSVALATVAALTLALVTIGPRLPLRAAFDELSSTQDLPPACSFCNCGMQSGSAGKCGCCGQDFPDQLR